MIKLLQGTNFQIKVPDNSCQFVATDGINKIIVSDILADTDENIYLIASSEITKDWNPTAYDYQIINENGLVESGRFRVLPNLLYWSTVDSYWKTVVKQIEKRLAGKAIDAAYSVSVDGKSISYMSTTDLQRLLDFAKNKVAEEEAEEEGKDPHDKNDQGVIRYIWK